MQVFNAAESAKQIGITKRELLELVDSGSVDYISLNGDVYLSAAAIERARRLVK